MVMGCAWALFSNHAHFPLRMGDTPLATPEARGLFCYLAVKELGYSMLEIADRLGKSQPGVEYALRKCTN